MYVKRKERVHSEMKTSERLDYCPHIQPITLIFLKSVPTFPDRVSISEICSSGDLHRTIRGPASHHPPTGPASYRMWTCIRTSEDLHQNIGGPASEHPRTCIRTSRSASHHPGTCMSCITPSEPASGHPYLHHFTVTFPAS